MTRAWLRGTVFWIASALSYAACDSSGPTLGGETNWLKTCTVDADCTGGTRCLCGLCTKTCSGDQACGSPGRSCASSGSPAYRATCDGENPGPGICLAKCGASGCSGTMTCTGGLCTPPPTRDSGSGGAPGIDVVTTGGASGSGGSVPPQRDATPERDAPQETSITDGSCSATGPWPASPTTFDPTCTPNCDGGSCGALCPTAADHITGMPCDTGCCASNTATLTVVPNSVPGAGGPAWTTVAASPSAKIYYGMAGGTSPPNPISFSYAATTDPRASLWPEVGTPDRSATESDGGASGLAQHPLFAFGKNQGRDVAFAAYTVVRAGPIGGRFGIQDGNQWTFEDLPGPPTAMTTDAQGAPLVLIPDRVLYRNDSGTWDSFCLPDIGGSDSAGIAADQTGAWFVARTASDLTVRVSRRNANGTWATESVTTGTPRAFAAAIAVGAGTVHVAYTSAFQSDAGLGPGGDLHYARRVGTSWVDHVVAVPATFPKSPGEELSIRGVQMAIDGCGAPHLGAYALGSVTFDAYYFRFTAAGWRGARFANTCDANISGGVTLSTTRAFLSFWSCAFQTAAIPLK